MADDNFKLPGSSYDVLKMIVQAYASLGRPASLEEVSKRASMDKTMISRNAGFLLSLNILEGGRDKAVTSLGKKLGDAYGHDMKDRVEEIISELTGQNEFMNDITSAVRIRGGMDEASLRAHIAYSAGKSKSAATTTGTGAVIDFLRDGGVLVESDGKLVLRQVDIAQGVDNPTSIEKFKSFVVREREKNLKDTQISASGKVASSSNNSSAGPFQINLDIKLNIDCAPDDVDQIGTKLRKMLRDLQSTNDSEN